MANKATIKAMEEMLGQNMGPLVNVRSFLENYKTIIFSEKELEEEKIIKGEKDCNLELLNWPEIDEINFIPGVTENFRIVQNDIKDDDVKHITTYKTYLDCKKEKNKSTFHRTEDSYKMASCPLVDVDNDEMCIPYEEVIITVRVYKPARLRELGKSLEKPVFSEEFECLGSNYLSELRDKISCICQNKHYIDVSENPKVELPTKETDPSFFFITDTFYNDTRNPMNADYSESIIEWARKSSSLKNVKFNVAKMEKTRFFDLELSLGFTQLYKHHGNCEHFFTFSQIKLMTPGAECLYKKQYPRLRSFGFSNHRMCHLCGKRNYVFIVKDSNRHTQNPAFLCKSCFEGYHYIDGTKVGTFKAYRIADNDTGDKLKSENQEEEADAKDESFEDVEDDDTEDSQDNAIIE